MAIKLHSLTVAQGEETISYKHNYSTGSIEEFNEVNLALAKQIPANAAKIDAVWESTKPKCCIL